MLVRWAGCSCGASAGTISSVQQLYPLEGEPIADKPGRSAFAYTDFELQLKVKEVRKLVVCGVTTDVCAFDYAGGKRSRI